MKRYDEDNIIKILLDLISDSSQKAVAYNLGITPQYLSDILKRRRSISERVAKELGFKKVSYFVEV